MKGNHRPVFILASILILTGLACSLTNKVSQQVQNEAENLVATAVQDMPAVQGETPLAENTEEVNIQGSLNQGLSGLDSYTSTLKVTMEGAKDDGTTTHQEITISQKINRTQDASDFSMTTVEDQSDPQVFESLQINSDTYLLGTDETGGCMYFGSSDAASPVDNIAFTPQDIVGTFENSDLIKKGEQVNGVSTNHYKVTSGYVFGILGSTSGEAWISPDGDYVVRYVGQAEVSETTTLLSTAVVNGQMTWEYNLTDINSLGEIPVPDACSQATSALSDIPIPENATDKSTFGGFISFSSPDSVSDVTDYYHQQLSGLGWQTNDDLSTEDMVTISGSKEGRTINVVISSDSGKTSVMISVSE
jgi:hypothetical protein